MRSTAPPHRRLRVLVPIALIIIVAVVVGQVIGWRRLGSAFHGTLSPAELAQRDIAAARAISPLRGRIVSVAEGQVGYRTDPANTYCNKYSAYWYSGTDDCGNSNLDEEWCADFAAWVWREAGVSFVYQDVNGDINASSASFYEWGLAHGTWHPVGSSYRPQPGDVAVYGLDRGQLFAVHVAIVISDVDGSRGPDAINGDGDQTGFSVVEIGTDESQADTEAKGAGALSGYVGPT